MTLPAKGGHEVARWVPAVPAAYGTHSTSKGPRPDLAVIDDRTRLDLDLEYVTDVIDAYVPYRRTHVGRLAAPREARE